MPSLSPLPSERNLQFASFFHDLFLVFVERTPCHYRRVRFTTQSMDSIELNIISQLQFVCYEIAHNAFTVCNVLLSALGIP